MFFSWFYKVNLYKVLYNELLESTSFEITLPKTELLPVVLLKHAQSIRYYIEENDHWLKQVNQDSFDFEFHLLLNVWRMWMPVLFYILSNVLNTDLLLYLQSFKYQRSV